MLILLQPGIQPLGQFDLQDGYIDSVDGGEVAAFESLLVTDGYASDVSRPGPQVHLVLGSATTTRPVWGLVDEGSSAGLGSRGYGTMFGQVIGATVGQGTGLGTLSTSGVVVVGPSTLRGSGKATLWTKPGLYGATQDAWDAASFSGAAINAALYGEVLTGKLTNSSSGNGVKIGYFLGATTDTSFVSTPPYYANATSSSEFGALYLIGAN